jgi:hypothetical protein
MWIKGATLDLTATAPYNWSVIDLDNNGTETPVFMRSDGAVVHVVYTSAVTDTPVVPDATFWQGDLTGPLAAESGANLLAANNNWRQEADPTYDRSELAVQLARTGQVEPYDVLLNQGTCAPGQGYCHLIAYPESSRQVVDPGQVWIGSHDPALITPGTVDSPAIDVVTVAGGSFQHQVRNPEGVQFSVNSWGDAAHTSLALCDLPNDHTAAKVWVEAKYGTGQLLLHFGDPRTPEQGTDIGPVGPPAGPTVVIPNVSPAARIVCDDYFGDGHDHLAVVDPVEGTNVLTPFPTSYRCYDDANCTNWSTGYIIGDPGPTQTFGNIGDKTFTATYASTDPAITPAAHLDVARTNSQSTINWFDPAWPAGVSTPGFLGEPFAGSFTEPATDLWGNLTLTAPDPTTGTRGINYDYYSNTDAYTRITFTDRIPPGATVHPL